MIVTIHVEIDDDVFVQGNMEMLNGKKENFTKVIDNFINDIFADNPTEAGTFLVRDGDTNLIGTVEFKIGS